MNIFSDSSIKSVEIKSSLDGVIITGDFLRIEHGVKDAKFSNQNGNIRWLTDLFGPTIEKLIGEFPDKVEWTSDGKGGIDSSEFYKLQNINPSEESWVKTYEGYDISSAQVEFVQKKFNNKFVIGYELSPIQKSILTHIGVPFVSISIHPIRFMKDLLFAVETNCEKIKKTISKHDYSSERIINKANLLKARARRERVISIKDNTALFCGQLNYDASLIFNKKMYNLLDFKENFFEMTRDFNEVLFKRHPHVSGDQDILDFVTSFRNVRFIDGSIYSYIPLDGIEIVSAISSSVLHEASFFNVKTNRLLENSLHQKGISNSIRVGNKFLNPIIWYDILSHYFICKKSENEYEIDVDNPIQYSLVTNWKPEGRNEEQRVDANIIRYGEKISFENGSGEQYIGSNWDQPEPWGRWVKGASGSVEIVLPQPSKSGLLVLPTIQASAGSDHPTYVNIYAGDRHVFGEKYTSFVRKKVEFRLSSSDIPEDRKLKLEFSAIGAASPRVISNGSQTGKGDSRSLGIGLIDLTIRPADGRHSSQLEERLSFGIGGTANDALVSGWAAPENHGAWSTGRYAKIQLSFKSLIGSDLVLRFSNYRCYITDLNPKSTIIFKCTGTELGRLTTEHYWSDCPFDLFVPRGYVNENGHLDIDLEFLNPISPMSVGESEDGRLLGMCLSEIAVLPASSCFERSDQIQDINNKAIVNVVGQIRINTGLGVHVRNVISSIAKNISEDDLKVTNFNKSNHEEVEFNLDKLVKNTNNRSQINIFCLNAHYITDYVNENRSIKIGEQYNIGYGAWELENMPERISDTSYIDEYWAQSDFVAAAARKTMNVPVQLMPLPVDAPWPKKLLTRKNIGIPENQFLFMFSFSVDSTLSRKNPYAIVEAFKRAFPEKDARAMLLLKTKIKQAHKSIRMEYEKFLKTISEDKRIKIIENNMTDDEIRSLYLISDAYISLHRSEGFGLTIAEAMAYGKPAIATAYSGNLSFMNDSNSCLVEYQLLDMKEGDYQGETQKWADPSINQASYYMRKLYEDEYYYKMKSRLGQFEIRKNFSLECIGKRYVARIGELNARYGFRTL